MASATIRYRSNTQHVPDLALPFDSNSMPVVVQTIADLGAHRTALAVASTQDRCALSDRHDPLSRSSFFRESRLRSARSRPTDYARVPSAISPSWYAENKMLGETALEKDMSAIARRRNSLLATLSGLCEDLILSTSRVHKGKTTPFELAT